MPIETLGGPSAAGKSRLLAGLKRNLDVLPLQSITTRPEEPRDAGTGEYRFVSRVSFEEMLQNDRFAWHTERYGNYYGTEREVVLDALHSSKHYVPQLTLDAVRKLHMIAGEEGVPHNVRSIYLHIQDEEELRRRLADDGRPDIEQRLDYRLWLEEVQTLGVRMFWINALLAPHEVLNKALQFILYGRRKRPFPFR